MTKLGFFVQVEQSQSGRVALPSLLVRCIYPPRRVSAVVTGGEETDLVAVGVEKVSLPPKPGTVGRWFDELDAKRRQAFKFGFDVALEIEDDVVGRHGIVVNVDGQRRSPVAAFEPGITRQGIDDAREAELFEKLDRLDGQFAVYRDLVEVHRLRHF